MISIEQIKNLEELESIRKDWNRLVELNHHLTVFQTFEWIHTWWQFHSDYGEMQTIVVKKNGQIIGIAPFMLSRVNVMGIPFKKLSFASPRSDYNDCIFSLEECEDFYNAILDYLFQNKKQWNIVSLKHISSESDTMEQLQFEAKKKNMLSFFYICSRCPYILLNTSWEDYFKKNFRRKSRYKLLRQERRLNDHAVVSMVRYSENIPLAQAMKIINEITRRSYKSRSGTPLFNGKVNRSFYLSIANRFYPKGWFDLVYLKAGEKPISYHYGFRFRRKYYYYNLAHDERYAEYSPGLVLLKELVRDSFANGCTEFDFLRGEEHYKGRWSTHTRDNYAIELVNEDRFSRFCYGFENYIEQVVKPRLWKIPLLVRLRNGIRWLALLKYRRQRWLDFR